MKTAIAIEKPVSPICQNPHFGTTLAAYDEALMNFNRVPDTMPPAVLCAAESAFFSSQRALECVIDQHCAEVCSSIGWARSSSVALLNVQPHACSECGTALSADRTHPTQCAECAEWSAAASALDVLKNVAIKKRSGEFTPISDDLIADIIRAANEALRARP